VKSEKVYDELNEIEYFVWKKSGNFEDFKKVCEKLYNHRLHELLDRMVVFSNSQWSDFEYNWRTEFDLDARVITDSKIDKLLQLLKGFFVKYWDLGLPHVSLYFDEDIAYSGDDVWFIPTTLDKLRGVEDHILSGYINKDLLAVKDGKIYYYDVLVVQYTSSQLTEDVNGIIEVCTDFEIVAEIVGKYLEEVM